MPKTRRIAALRLRVKAGLVRIAARRDAPSPAWGGLFSDPWQRTAAGFLRWDLHPGFTVEDHLLADRTFACEPRTKFFRQQFCNDDAHVDGVADSNRGTKIQRLRNINCAWSGQTRSE